MLTIIDPEFISKEEEILDELKRNGLNHLTGSPALGWNYVIDHVWITMEMQKFLADKRGRELVILDVGCGRSKLHNFLEKKFNISILGIDRPYGYCHQNKTDNVDYYEDFLEMNSFDENSVDAIFWLSAIEHNEPEKIRELYKKSMALLKDGGLFLATFALSDKTSWLEASQQTNLSIPDSMDIFDEKSVQHTLDEIREKYRANVLYLRDKYQKRYQKFNCNDPEFVVGGIKKIKTATSADEVPCHDAQEKSRDYLYLFVPSNDTHVHLMNPVAQKLESAKFMIFETRQENAEYYLNKLGHEYFKYQNGILRSINPSVVIFANDWGPEERQLVKEVKSLGIPTVCLQEGCLDFIDTSINRMMHADYAFMQGPLMKKYIRRSDNVIITGNPKYDSMNDLPLPDKPVVLINANFTYGIYEDIRDQWVADAVSACRGLNLDFFISQHPRDRGEFPVDYHAVRSDAFKLKPQIEKSSLILTRFSTIIYEAVIQGRGVVYYNPHKEPFRIFTEDDTGAIEIASSRTDLAEAIKKALEGLDHKKEERDSFILKHCNTVDHDASEKCAEQLRLIAETDGRSTGDAKQQNLRDDEDHEVMVSVIVPTHNRPEMVADAVKSVLDQKYKNFELLVVNDAGPDIEPIITSMNGKSNITYVRHSVNRGLAAARNTGIKLSRGKYIAYLDDDDIFYPDHLETLVHYLENSDHKIVYTDAHRAHQVKENGQYVTQKIDLPYSQDFDYDQILVSNFVPVLCFMHEKSCLDKTGLFDESLPVVEDWDLWIRMSRFYEMPHIKKVTAEFRSRDDGTSMTSKGMEAFYRTGIAVHKKYRDYAKDKPHVLDAQKRAYMMYNLEMISHNSPDKGNDLNNRIKLAATFISESKFLQAIDEYAELAKQYPDIEVFYAVLCDLYSLEGRSDIPGEWVTRTIMFDPSYSDSFIDMTARLIEDKQYADAEKILTAVEKASTDNCEVLDTLNSLRSEMIVQSDTKNNKRATMNEKSAGHDIKGMASIIIPVMNNLEYTKQCLEALSLNTAYEPYEVIIIDNASTDGTGEFLKCLEGNVKIITNGENLGFARSCNQGAMAAEGEFLVFLNNDTVPEPGWLDSMVSVADGNPDVAVVGSKLLYPDDRVQHAGVVFGCRESGLSISHIYKGIEREHPAVNYLREFNAVTAACMLVKRNVFLALDMFDEGFLNGYEDVDFCLRVREKGLKIMYNPESTLLHYEESTEGRLDHGERNTLHFLSKWKGKIEPDEETKVHEDGFRIEYLPDNRALINCSEQQDKCISEEGKKYEYKRRPENEEILPEMKSGEMNKKKLAIVRGANINKWEMQNYEPLRDMYSITAYTTEPHVFDLSHIQFPVVKLPCESQGLLLDMKGLEDHLSDKDLIYSADITYRFSEQAVQAKQKYGCKVVCLEWENIPFNYDQYEEVHRIKKTVRHGADHFIAVTQRAKEALMLEGVSEARIDVVPMGVDLNVFKPDKKNIERDREKIGIGNDEIVVLFIGRMVWEKGIYDLIHAATGVIRDDSIKERFVRFLIIGKGPELDGVHKRITDLGIGSHVTLLEEYPYHYMHRLHNLSDIFVLPSISTRDWQEQFGMVLIESMACGKPVISTRSGSIPEVVGDDGILIQPNDHLSLYGAIKKLILDHALRAELGARALSRAKKMFDSQRTAERIRLIFEKVLNKKTEEERLNEDFMKGMQLWKEGSRVDGFEVLCRTFEEDPDRKNVLDSIVQTGRELKRHDAVENYIREYLLYHPANLDALASLAQTLIDTGKIDRAEDELAKIFIFDREHRRAVSLVKEIEAARKQVKV